MTLTTVVIPTYNRPTFVEQAVRSVLQQSCRPAVIVVDDGSTLPHTDAMLGFRDRAEIQLISGGHRGVAHARNVGAERSSTEFILFLDDDDTLVDGGIGQLEALLHKSGQHAAAGGGTRCFPDGKRGEIELPPGPLVSFDRLIAGNPFFTGAVIVRRSAFIAAGGFEERIPIEEDWDLWIKLARICPIPTIAVPIVDYRVHGDNMSASSKVARLSVALVRHYLREFDAADRTRLGPPMVSYATEMYASHLAWHIRKGLRRGALGPAWRDARTLISLVGMAASSREGRTALRSALRGHLSGTA